MPSTISPSNKKKFQLRLILQNKLQLAIVLGPIVLLNKSIQQVQQPISKEPLANNRITPRKSSQNSDEKHLHLQTMLHSMLLSMQHFDYKHDRNLSIFVHTNNKTRTCICMSYGCIPKSFQRLPCNFDIAWSANCSEKSLFPSDRNSLRVFQSYIEGKTIFCNFRISKAHSL